MDYDLAVSVAFWQATALRRSTELTLAGQLGGGEWRNIDRKSEQLKAGDSPPIARVSVGGCLSDGILSRPSAA